MNTKISNNQWEEKKSPLYNVCNKETHTTIDITNAYKDFF